ncbi:MAG TPA: cupredoxin domain-containing protein [Mycobacteriales bacterium]|nr:cupredoxin domain-containing protein [Mycobacteriales bacterium]
MTGRSRLLRPTAALLLLAAVTACADDAPDLSPAAPSEAGTASSTPAAAASPTAGTAVQVKATQRLVFDPDTLAARVGVEFRGRITQVGQLPHDIEIEGLVSATDTFVTMPGESKPFSFTASKAGQYPFVCTIHPAEMKGVLTVT